MGVFDIFRGRWSLATTPRPWKDRVAIYTHIKEHTDPLSGRLRDSGVDLPDQPPQEGPVLWAPGALDGVFGHHVAAADTHERAAPILDALAALLTGASSAHFERFYALVIDGHIIDVIDSIADAIRAQPRFRPERVRALGVILAREAPDRDAVKLGIALLGMIQGAEDRPLLLELGVHEELTLFVAVALMNQSEDHEPALWTLAQRVEGWGRIGVVERLAGTRDPAIRAWLLREGFRNSLMSEYLAYTCAMGGELHVALATTSPDDALLRGAAGLFAALARGGPAEDLADYPHAEVALRAWLAHVERRPLDLDTVEALDELRGRPEIAAPLAARIEALRSSAAALSTVRAGLESSETRSFRLADEAARLRDLETFSAHARFIAQCEGDVSSSIFRMMQEASEDTIDRALDIAASRIDLSAIATGPSTTFGRGPAFAAQRALESVLHELVRFPGRGSSFIEAGLGSPVVGHRNLVLRSLAEWGLARWSPELRALVARAAECEPQAELRERFTRVLAGQPFAAA